MNHQFAQLNRIYEGIDNLPLGVVIFNGRREVVYCNRRYREIYRLTSEQAGPGTLVSELIQHRLDLGLKVDANPDGYIQDRVGTPVQAAADVHEFADGRIIAYTISPLEDGGGMATHEDITEREQLNARLKAQYALVNDQDKKLRNRNLQFDAAINNMSQGLCFFDGAQRLIVCNDQYIAMYNLPPERVGPGTTLAEVVDMRFEAGSFPDMSRDDYLNWRNNVVTSKEDTDSIVELRNGRTFKIRHRPMPDGGWVATHEDVTEQRRSEVKIAHMAHHDALTDLANRTLLNERLEQALTWSQRGDLIVLHHIDLDKFKAVNDTLGHPAGDRLLKAVAGRLQKLVRSCDTVARVGGDEFAVVQTGITQPADAIALAQRIIKSLCEPFDIDGHQAVIGASIGIAVGPGDGRDPDELLRNADLALYRAKDAGRATFRFFEPGMDLKMQARRMMEQDMRRALPAGEFELYYQPVVNLNDNAISGFEALLRWNHPERGMIPPDAFIPLAEEIGFIVQIGEWVVRRACATAASWPEHLRIAVNISAIQFRNQALTPIIIDTLEKTGLNPNRLEIEITETVLMQDKGATLAVLHELRKLGVRIALDDFGTGYSSLTYLQCFPFDKIKIDRSFIQDVPANIGSLNIVRAVTGLAAGFGMATTAEGVETTAQRDSIASEGCTEMQGFLFSKPLPAADIERLFLSKPGKTASGFFAA